jgi:hypothetical protein
MQGISGGRAAAGLRVDLVTFWVLGGGAIPREVEQSLEKNVVESHRGGGIISWARK